MSIRPGHGQAQPGVVGWCGGHQHLCGAAAIRDQGGVAGPWEAAVSRARAYGVITDGRSRQRPYGRENACARADIIKAKGESKIDVSDGV